MKGGSTLFKFHTTLLSYAQNNNIDYVMICNFQISTIMGAIFRYWKSFAHVQSVRPYWCWADTKHNKFHYYIKITSQHHVEITMTLQLRHICSLDKINPVWRCPSNVCIVYPHNGEIKRCSTLFNNVERGLTLFNFLHFDRYILSSIQVGLSFDNVRYDRRTFDNYPIIHLWAMAMTCDNQ